jgi:hypothetical protein
MNAELFAVADAQLRAARASAPTNTETNLFDTQLTTLTLVRELWAEVETLRIVAYRLRRRVSTTCRSIIQTQQMVQTLSASRVITNAGRTRYPS